MNIVRNKIIILLISLVCICNVGCAKQNESPNATPTSNEENVAEKEEWVYYTSKLKMYKRKADGSNKQELCKGDITCMDVVKDYVYYADDNRNAIYKIKTDGTEKQKICLSYYSKGMSVQKDWIYFAQEGSVFKMKTDGTQKEALHEDAYVVGLDADDDWVYYTHLYSHAFKKNGIYKIRKDGTKKQMLISEPLAERINVFDGWIYYIDITNFDVEKGILCRIKTDGTEKQEIDTDVYEMFAQENYLYYIVKEGKDTPKYMYRIKAGENEPERLWEL